LRASRRVWTFGVDPLDDELTRFDAFAAFLQFEEAHVGLVVAARDGVLVVVEAFEGVRGFAEGEEGVGEWRLGGGAVGQFGRAAVERSGFDVPGPEFAPSCYNHAIDEVALTFTDGLKLFDIFVEELLERFRGLAGKDDGLGGEAVTDGVLG